jgi:hypothetical protein
MTLEQFSHIFALLAVQLRFTDADDATIRGYFEALKDLEPELLAFAAQRMAQRGGADSEHPHWFPKTSEWRAMSGKIEGERAEQLKGIQRKLPQPQCLVCDDTGWTRAKKIGTQSSSEDRWKHCDCRQLRRLEILGRRPMPQLTGESVPVRPVPSLTGRVRGMR